MQESCTNSQPCKVTRPGYRTCNIENGDREFIGNVLLKIDSLNPIVVGIDAFFKNKKSEREDSVLINALQKIDNDILSYGLNSENKFEGSELMFTKFAKENGC